MITHSAMQQVVFCKEMYLDKLGYFGIVQYREGDHITQDFKLLYINNKYLNDAEISLICICVQDFPHLFYKSDFLLPLPPFERILNSAAAYSDALG